METQLEDTQRRAIEKYCHNVYLVPEQIQRIFERLKLTDEDLPLVVVMDGDAGRTLGNILVRELNVPGEVISVDNVQLRDFDFVDIGEEMPDTRVVPLIIKSLLFTQPGDS